MKYQIYERVQDPRETVNASDCDSNQPNGENLSGPFDTEAEAKAASNNYTGDMYVVYDDLMNTGYYLYRLDGEIQSPAFRRSVGSPAK